MKTVDLGNGVTKQVWTALAKAAGYRDPHCWGVLKAVAELVGVTPPAARNWYMRMESRPVHRQNSMVKIASVLSRSGYQTCLCSMPMDVARSAIPVLPTQESVQGGQLLTDRQWWAKQSAEYCHNVLEAIKQGLNIQAVQTEISTLEQRLATLRQVIS